MRSHRDDISPDPNMESHPYDNFLDALAEFISKNQSKYDELLQQTQENYRKINFSRFLRTMAREQRLTMRDSFAYALCVANRRLAIALFDTFFVIFIRLMII